MRWLLFFMLMNTASATTLTQVFSTPEVTSEQRFNVTKSQAHYEKRSNFFDKEKNLTLGKFKSSDEKSLEAILKPLEKALAKIKEVDEFMKKKNSNFNQFSSKSAHVPYFLLDDYRITQGSILYPEIKSLFEKLQGLKWKQTSGIELSSDFKTMSIIEDEKVTSKTEFNFRLQCRDPSPPTFCLYKSYGVLFLK